MCHMYRLRINTHVLTYTMLCFIARQFLLLLLLGMILEGVEVVMRMVSLVLLLTVGLIGLFGMTHHFEFESIFVKEVV